MSPRTELKIDTDDKAWRDITDTIHDLVAKPDCYCHFVDIGVGYQKAAEDPMCPRCTSDGMADRIVGELFARGWRPPAVEAEFPTTEQDGRS